MKKEKLKIDQSDFTGSCLLFFPAKYKWIFLFVTIGLEVLKQGLNILSFKSKQNRYPDYIRQNRYFCLSLPTDAHLQCYERLASSAFL